MASKYLHPGVYVEELPGPQQITGAGSSTTVFVGWTEQGPENTPTFIDSWNAFTRTFGNFVWSRNVPFAVYNFFAEGGSLAYVVRATSTTPTISASHVAGSLRIAAAAPGDWGNLLAIQILNYPTEDPPSATAKSTFVLRVLYPRPAAGAPRTVIGDLVERYATINNALTISQGNVTYWIIEEFPGLTQTDLAKPSDQVLSSIESRINGQSLFIRVTAAVDAKPTSRPSNLLNPTPLAGGAGNETDTPINYETALESLDPRNDISLLVLPDTGMVNDLTTQRALIQQGLSYCEQRNPRDIFMIADSPFGLNVQDVTAFKTGAALATRNLTEGNALNSSYGAIYYPWIDFFNGTTSRSVPIPPSGAIAGTYAETDRRVGVFKAPAGTLDGQLSSAVGLSTLVTSTQQDVLNPNGINAIRNLPRTGIVTYGARTLSTDPSLIYISVRRLLIYIQVSLYWGLQWVVFEPNNQKLWGAVNRDVSEFLTGVWKSGGLFGARESEAFKVQVNEGNNPPESRNQGILYIDIQVAPVRPAEFVVIRIQQATLPSG